MKRLFRSPEVQKIYLENLNSRTPDSPCALCLMTPIKTFKYWKIVVNDFPYDLITPVHHMAIPLRHTIEVEFTEDELTELKQLKRGYLNDQYEFLLEGTDRTKSIPAHFHLHLLDLNEP
jgi:hypothetical protein